MNEENPKSIEVAKPKKKKKKTGIIYGIPGDRAKFEVKNILNMTSYSTQCHEYLVNRYSHLSEKLVSKMLENHEFVMMPSWSRAMDNVMKDLNKDLYNTITTKISGYTSSNFLRDLRYPKYASISISMEAMMREFRDQLASPGYPSYEYQLFEIVCRMKNSVELITNLTKDKSFLNSSALWIGTCAEFECYNPIEGYPAFGIVMQLPIGFEGANSLFGQYGILFKMKDIRGGKTIFIGEDESLYSYDGWKELLGAIELGRVGKVLGDNTYIAPYAKIAFVLNPLTLERNLRWINIR